MKIAFITAGAGKMYCGACLHDALLIQGLIDAGHALDVYTMYTPALADFDLSILKTNKIYYSGINAYLSQKFSFFRKIVPGLHGFFGKPSVVNFALNFGVSVRPEELGGLTLSVLRGIEGHQSAELKEVISALRESGKKDLAVITNSMIAGLAPELKKEFKIPVVCQLMGEEVFVKDLPEPFRSGSIKAMREHSKHIDLFISPGETYAGEMALFLEVAREKFRVVPPAVSPELYAGVNRLKEPFTVGYISKMSKGKGLDTLVDAFILLRKKHEVQALLKLGGQILSSQAKSLWEEQQKKLKKEGLWEAVEYRGELDFKSKKELLSAFSVFAVPSMTPESRGTAALEALSAGIPVILPESGIYPELLAKTGGGLLHKPNNAESLALGLKKMAEDPVYADACAAKGREAVKKYYSQKVMTDAAIGAYSSVI